MRKLSSGLTWLYKIVLPVSWFGLMGWGSLSMFIDPGSARLLGNTGSHAFGMVLAWLMGSVLLYLNGAGLKTVVLDGEYLSISNYLKTIRVPLQNVEHASSNRLVGPERIYIKLRFPAEFGTEIKFLPPLRLMSAFNDDPITGELNALAQKARESGPISGEGLGNAEHM